MMEHSTSFTASVGSEEPCVHALFEKVTGTWQYIVVDPSSMAAAIIDPVLDFDPVARKITTTTADSLLSLIEEKGYNVDHILETHAHADHLTSASYLKQMLYQKQGYAPSIGIGQRIGQVQKMFGTRYGIPGEEYNVVFDKLFEDDENFGIGTMKATALHLPGHTPDHMGYKIGGEYLRLLIRPNNMDVLANIQYLDNVFCGDSIFHPDIGTARCDFPGGSANSLWQSSHRILNMADAVKIWVGHDYPPKDRNAPVPWMHVKDHKRLNKHLRDGITEEQFVSMRNERDATLGEPKLLHQSLQINIRGGRLPKPNETGHRIISFPLNSGSIEV